MESDTHGRLIRCFHSCFGDSLMCHLVRSCPKATNNWMKMDSFWVPGKGGATQRCCDEKEVDPTSNPKTFSKKKETGENHRCYLFFFDSYLLFFALAVNREISTVCYFFFCCWVISTSSLPFPIVHCEMAVQSATRSGKSPARHVTFSRYPGGRGRRSRWRRRSKRGAHVMDDKKKRRFKRSTQSKQKRRESRRTNASEIRVRNSREKRQK